MKITFLANISCLLAGQVSANEQSTTWSLPTNQSFSILILFVDAPLLKQLGFPKKQDPFEPFEVKKYFDVPVIYNPQDVKFKALFVKGKQRTNTGRFGRPPRVIPTSYGKDPKQKIFKRR